MRERFGYEIEALKQLLLDLATAAQVAVIHAVGSVDKLDAALARKIIADDKRIDAMEVHIEEECLKLIALYQPVAGDLRTLITVLKVNSELERIADLAANIAARVVDMSELKPIAEVQQDFAPMFLDVQQMLKDAMDAFIYHETDLARRILLQDDKIDAMNAEHFKQARELLLAHPEHAAYILDGCTISHALERIADVVTNICEDVIYLDEGQIVRHRKLLS